MRTSWRRFLKWWLSTLGASVFWYGFGSVLDINGSYFRPAYPRRRSDAEAFADDAVAIRSDWEAVLGPDLGKTGRPNQ